MRELTRSLLNASRSDRFTRLTASMLVSLGLLLVLSANGLTDDDNDCDDDNGRTRCCHPTIVECKTVSTCTCPKEKHGQFPAGTYWYDMWKTSSCLGGVIEGIPHSANVNECPLGDACDPNDCIVWRFIGTMQPNYCRKDERFVEDSGDRDQHLDVNERGFAWLIHQGEKYCFKLVELSTTYPHELTRTRLIGVQVDPDHCKDVLPDNKPAKWTDPNRTTEYVHEIDVEFPINGDPNQHVDYTFTVTTKDRVP